MTDLPEPEPVVELHGELVVADPATELSRIPAWLRAAVYVVAAVTNAVWLVIEQETDPSLPWRAGMAGWSTFAALLAAANVSRRT